MTSAVWAQFISFMINVVGNSLVQTRRTASGPVIVGQGSSAGALHFIFGYSIYTKLLYRKIDLHSFNLLIYT